MILLGGRGEKKRKKKEPLRPCSLDLEAKAHRLKPDTVG